MKYGVILPNVGPLAHIDALAGIAQRAEELEYDGVFLSDHVAIPPTCVPHTPTALMAAFPSLGMTASWSR